MVYVLVIGLHQSHWLTHHGHCVARQSHWAAHRSYRAAHPIHWVARLGHLTLEVTCGNLRYYATLNDVTFAIVTLDDVTYAKMLVLYH